MLNRVIIMGRLCADPEYRQTTAGISCCRFRVSVNRPKKQDGSQEADFIGCIAWRSTADFISRYFGKGQMILAEGQLRNNDYTDQNGVKHYGMDVLVERVSFCGSKNESDQTANEAQRPASEHRKQNEQPQSQAQAQPASDLNLDDFEEILSDGEVPF